VDIPLKCKIVVVNPICPLLLSKVWFILDLINGYCAVSSIVIKAFSFDFAILNSWAFPSPKVKNVTAVPALVVDIKNELLVTFFAKTVVGNWSTIEPFLNSMGVEPTPTNVAAGL